MNNQYNVSSNNSSTTEVNIVIPCDQSMSNVYIYWTSYCITYTAKHLADVIRACRCHPDLLLPPVHIKPTRVPICCLIQTLSTVIRMFTFLKLSVMSDERGHSDITYII